MINFANRKKFPTAQAVYAGLATKHRAMTGEVVAAAGLDAADPLMSTYLALAGVLDPPPEPLGSSFCSREAMAAALADIIHGIRHGTPGVQIGIAEIRHPGWRSDGRPTVFIRSATKYGKALLPRFSAGSFACVQLALLPGPDPQEGFVVETRLRVLGFSTDREQTELEITKAQRRPSDEKPTIQWKWLNPSDRLVAAAPAALLCAADPAHREAIVAARELEQAPWIEQADVRRRYRFLMLARCPLSKMFFGTGFAQHRARALVNDAKYAAKQRAKLNPSLIEVDEAVCFAWDEAVRLGELGLRLPFIELR